jgi:hypothetical protein
MAKLSDFIAHDLITTASGKLLGAEQAQYLAPKESPIFSGNVTISKITAGDIDNEFLIDGYDISGALNSNIRTGISMIKYTDTSGINIYGGGFNVISCNGKTDTEGQLTIGERGHGLSVDVKGDNVFVGTQSIGIELDELTESIKFTGVSTFTGGIITDGFSGNFRYHSDLNPDILLTDYLVAGTDNPSDPAILPKASTCKGKVIVLLCSVDDIGFTVNSFSGDSIILSNSGGPTTTITIASPYNSKTLISDGAATWYQIQ